MGAYRQTGPYMPQADSAFRDWLVNFANLVQANPYRYGLGPADASVIVNLKDSYERAYIEISKPSTRTPSAITGKDAIKASAMATMRIYAGLIRANMGVDQESRIELRLKLPNRSRSLIPAPATAPLLNPICGYPLVSYLRCADESTPNSRRKPAGVAFLQLAVAIHQPGEPLPTRPEQAHTHLSITKQPILVQHRPEDGGKTAGFWGRWMSARGLTGPWSSPAYLTVVTGGCTAPDVSLKQMRVPELDRLGRERQHAMKLAA